MVAPSGTRSTQWDSLAPKWGFVVASTGYPSEQQVSSWEFIAILEVVVIDSSKAPSSLCAICSGQ
ncbi:hypothetical protein WG66_011660 [Moniliophthora roreri]|nr:hypothetical protein WG66_011660 [Moniliophthora roreri]